MRRTLSILAVVVAALALQAEPVCVDGVCYPSEEAAREAGVVVPVGAGRHDASPSPTVRAEGAADVKQFTVTVEWVKNRTWGYNPYATVYSYSEVTKDHASGYGYDKESAAIAGAFNSNSEVMRILYKHLENGGVFPYGVTLWGGLVSFDGGCGVSTFYNIFDALGYEFKQVVSGQHCAAYRVTKKA